MHTARRHAGINWFEGLLSMDTEMKPSLVIVGDATVDLLAQVGGLPKPGEDAVVEQLTLLPGGSAANCAAAAARLGCRVRLVGVSGQDIFADLLRQDLEQAGVDIQYLRQLPGSTSLVISIIDRSGERTFLSYRGAAAAQDYGPLPASLLQPGDTLHVSGYAFQTPHSRSLALSLMSRARTLGASISLDPSYVFARDLGSDDGALCQLVPIGVRRGDDGALCQLVPIGVRRGGNGELLAGLDYLFPNEEEALLITGASSAEQAARRLVELGVRTVLVKLGAGGCLVAAGDELHASPAYEVSHVVDSTGAGDDFAGGFFAASARGCSLREAVAVGQAAAAIVITHVGGHAGAPNLPELRDFARHRGDDLLLGAVERMLS